MKAIVIWGAGGHAKVVAQSLRRTGRWQVIGFVDDLHPQRAGEAFEGSVVLSGGEVLPQLRERGCRHVALAFGHNTARLRLWTTLSAQGFDFPPVIDPHAVVADAVPTGPGCYVAAGAVVQPGAQLGAQVIVNTGAVVEHDCRVGDGAHLSPRCCLAGHAQIGEGAWVGAGAVVRDRVRVGAWAVVGMGSVVLKDIPERVLAYGQPCRSIREVQA